MNVRSVPQPRVSTPILRFGRVAEQIDDSNGTMIRVFGNIRSNEDISINLRVSAILGHRLSRLNSCAGRRLHELAELEGVSPNLRLMQRVAVHSWPVAQWVLRSPLGCGWVMPRLATGFASHDDGYGCVTSWKGLPFRFSAVAR
jgi:hypothetical protein